MSTNVGEVDLSLGLNTSDFNKRLNNAANVAEGKMSQALGNITSFIGKAFAVTAVVGFGKVAVDTASQAQSAWTGLNSIVSGQGRSFKEAESFLNGYIDDGLVPLNNAVTSYKNLVSRGYDTSQIEQIMDVFKNTAAFGRQSSYTMGEAIQGATEGLKNENSILVDNVGVTKNVAKMWDEYARSIGTTSNNLTLAQKRQAEVNGILEESKFQMGDAQAYTNTFAGRMAQLTTAFTNVKIAVGNVIAPIAQMFIPVLTGALNAVTRFFNGIGQILSVLGVKFPKVISNGTKPALDSISSGVGKATDSMGSAGKQAKKTAKEINRAFASVDELNVINLPDKSDSASSGGSGGSGSAGGASDESPLKMDYDTSQTDALSDWAMNFKKIMESVWEVISNSKSFKALSDAGKTVFDSLIGNAKSLYDSFTSIFGSLVNAIKDTIIQKAPEIDSAFASLFKGAGDFITANIELILAPFRGFTNGMAEALMERAPELTDSVAEIFLQLTDFVGSCFSELSIPLTQFADDFALGFSDLGSTAMNMITDLANGLAENMPEIIGDLTEIKDAFISEFTILSDIVGRIWKDFTGVLKSTWDEDGKYISEGIGKLINNLSEIFRKLYSEVLDPIIKPFLEEFQQVWKESLEPTLKEVMKFVSNLIKLGIDIFNNFISPVVNFLTNILKPVFISTFSFLGSVINTLIKTVSDLIKELMRILNGLIDFISGVFSGNWRRAWIGIADAFSGVFGSLGSLLKAPMNAVIGSINSVFNGLKSIKVPDWVPGIGGKSFDFPRIPMLAQGGYVKANNPQLAIIGDNKREGEIVAPESKLEEALTRALDKKGNGYNGSMEIILKVEYEDGRTIIKKINKTQEEEGRVLLDV